MRVGAQFGDLVGREAAALVKHRRGRQIRRSDEERVGHLVAVERARGGGHGRIELEHRLGRLFLVPDGHAEHAAVGERAHIGLHRLLGVGELLDDGEAAGIGKAGRVGEAQIDDVELLVGVFQEVPALVVDHPDLGENIAGKILENGVVERFENGAVALGDSDCAGPRAQRHFGRDAAAELGDEGLGRLLDHIGVEHREKVEVRRLLVGEVAHHADGTVAVNIETEVGVGRHLRQIETRVVGEAGSEVQIGGRVGLDEAEGRRTSRRPFWPPADAAHKPRPYSH